MQIGESGGLLLSLVTESFAVRALLGSLAAAALAAALVGLGVVRSARARRLVLLTPALTAAVTAVASVGEAYLPQLLWVSHGANTAAGMLLELLGQSGRFAADRGLDVLVLSYAAISLVLVARRACGFVAVRRLVASAPPAPSSSRALRELRCLAATMGLRTPRLLLLPGCPGGAFTAGTLRPVIAVDPALVDHLDEHELQGLLAHELAHIARRDTLLGAVVGLLRDLAFFLPPLHLAARWLRREQEESADELACEHTGRPAALASSILKVWDRSHGRQAPRHACAAVPGRLAVPSGVVSLRVPGADPMGALTARIERLIARVPAPTPLRRLAETALAAVVLVSGAAAALAVPGWIASEANIESVNFGYLTPTPPQPVEAPAFATFRAIAPPTSAASSAAPAAGLPWERTGAQAPCVCVESRAQLHEEQAARAPQRPHRLSWGGAEQPAWQLAEPYPDAAMRQARPLWTTGDSGPQVGVFLLSRR